MSGANRFGLSRYIDAETKSIVRRRCGFGCVLCGRAIGVYHHFDPPFKDASSHLAEGIVFLCPGCHTKVEAGLVSAGAVVNANRNPVGLQKGYARDDLFFERTEPYVRMGGAKFFCQYPIVFGKEVILGFEPPEEPGAPLRLNGRLYGPSGERIFEIFDNEFRVGADLFDVAIVKNRLTIRSSNGAVIFAMRFSSDVGMDIEVLDMRIQDFKVTLGSGHIAVSRNGRGTMRLMLGSLRAQAGVWLQPNKGATVGSNGLPFLNTAVEDFTPDSELEHLLVLCRDGAEEWQRFARALNESEVFVLQETVPSLPAGSIKVTMLQTTGCNWRDVAIVTSIPRINAIVKRIGAVGRPVAVPFKGLALELDGTTGVVFNPFSAVTLQMSPAKLCAWRAQN